MHTCLFRGCRRKVAADLACCGEHWRMLPEEHRYAIRGAYDPGQTAATASAAWHLAIARADAWVVATFGADVREPDRGRWAKLRETVKQRDKARAARREALGVPPPSHLRLVP